MGKIDAICISKKKGTVKTPVESIELIEGFGLSGDAHAGSERQVSLLSYETVEDFKKKAGAVSIVPGVFGVKQHTHGSSTLAQTGSYMILWTKKFSMKI